MKSIYMLVKSNLRKSKNQVIGLVLLVVIAAMFLYIGLTMYFGMGRFFDERAEQLNAAHIIVFTNNADRLDLIKNFYGVGEVETQDIITGFGGFGGDMVVVAFTRVHYYLTMNPLTTVGNVLPLTDNAVYLPYSILRTQGFNIGDTITILFSGTELDFTLAGGTEDIMVNRLYVSDATFYRLYNQFPNNRQTLVSVRMTALDYVGLLGWEVINLLPPCESDAANEAFVFRYWQARGVLSIPEIVAAFLTIFSFILLAVSLIVIRFRIINDIEENMINIGVLKGVGFSNIQINISIILQFSILAFFGSILGLISSHFTLPFATRIVEPMLGLVWNPAFDIYYAVIVLVTVLIVVSLTSFLSSRRINKLHPIIALRGGITTHSFKKNPLPLDKSRTPLNLNLSLKKILQNKKQAVMIAFIMVALMFASTATIAIHHNLNTERESFIRLTLGELPDTIFILNDTAYSETFRQSLRSHPDVRSAFGFDHVSLFVDGGPRVTFFVVEDFSYLEGGLLIRGRYPRHNNEIALGTRLMSGWHRQIGDTIVLQSTEAHETEREFFITGVIQTIDGGGLSGIMDVNTLMFIESDFIFRRFYVYLNDGVDHWAFRDSILEEKGDMLLGTFIIEDYLNQMEFVTLGNTFAALAYVTVSVTAIIIVLVLFLVIKTVILRNRREFGIKKALGFTTLQLMNQIALNLTPIIFLGVAIGAIAGYFGFNPLAVFFMQGMGVVQANLSIPIGLLAIVCIALIVLAYVISMLIAWRIRKISAYGLISES